MAEMQLAASSDGAPDLLRVIALGDANARHQAVYRAMLAFAGVCLESAITQIAADTLAFLLQAHGVCESVRDEAAEVFDELERRICPRVILDARSFAEGMDLPAMLEYLLDVIESETT